MGRVSFRLTSEGVDQKEKIKMYKCVCWGFHGYQIFRSPSWWTWSSVKHNGNIFMKNGVRGCPVERELLRISMCIEEAVSIAKTSSVGFIFCFSANSVRILISFAAFFRFSNPLQVFPRAQNFVLFCLCTPWQIPTSRAHTDYKQCGGRVWTTFFFLLLLLLNFFSMDLFTVCF